MIYDALIIGSGVAGLSCAINMPSSANVLVMCKGAKTQTNTYMAQGGVAVATDVNDIKVHINDTLSVGGGLNNQDAVKLLCESGYEAIGKLIDIGLEFDKTQSNEFARTKEAGHSTSRIFHANGDATGQKIADFLLQICPFPVRDNLTVVDLLIKDSHCYGVCVLNEANKLENIYARKVVIASGGIGSLYKYSTNEPLISAQLHGICAKKGIELQDMHLMQFHPTTYIDKSKARAYLLSEALRGEGAWLIDEQNHRFAFDYDPRGELAPRDTLSRAIVAHTKANHTTYLSFANFNELDFTNRFPNISSQMARFGFHLPKDCVPIQPAFHYAIGGIKCELDTRVCGMDNLFVIGEAASSRVHGANRLASNSLLEGIAFGKIAAEAKYSEAPSREFETVSSKIICKNDTDIKTMLGDLLWKSAGVTRNEAQLIDANEQITEWLGADIGQLIKLELLAARQIVQSALNTKYSIGAHYLEPNDNSSN